jgi:hypothetical protein
MLPCCNRLRQLLEMSVETRAQCRPLRSIGAGAREHDEVPRRQGRLVAKGFARETLELIAVHGAFRGST